MLSQQWEKDNTQRVQHLPKDEQFPFSKWLDGQTRPWIDGIPEIQQDGYFPWDYETWKEGAYNDHIK